MTVLYRETYIPLGYYTNGGREVRLQGEQFESLEDAWEDSYSLFKEGDIIDELGKVWRLKCVKIGRVQWNQVVAETSVPRLRIAGKLALQKLLKAEEERRHGCYGCSEDEPPRVFHLRPVQSRQG